MKSRRFVDEAVLYVAAGNGGNGCASFRREKYVPRGGPDGGDGGRGGHVLLRVDPNTDSLLALYYSPHQRAEHGGNGAGQKRHGRDGRDRIVLVPPGTEVWDETRTQQLADLVHEGQEWIAARGGRGGLGNVHWKSPTHRAPREQTDGDPGEQKTLRLELKLVADAGFVGLPNAGKSSLVRAISHAHPRVAAYPFTTLHPIIGTVMCDDFHSFTVADIPGLVRGAHEGIGLGHRFLRHVERSAVLVLVMDMAGTEGRHPSDDYEALLNELRLYRQDLLQRPRLVVANKMDLQEATGFLAEFKQRTGTEPLPVSAVTGQGIPEFKRRLRQMIRREY